MQDLTDRVAWITGAASGIGLAIAHELAAARMKLVLVDVEAAPLAGAETALRERGASVLAIRADVSDVEQMTTAAARAKETFGVVHVIVNNAGVGGGGGPSWLVAEADWRWAIDVNLWGVIHGIRLLLPDLVASGEEGHIVNTASIAGLTSSPFLTPYTATKHAVVAISECLAKELELTKSKVGVSVLCPGFVKTNIASSQRNHPVIDVARVEDPRAGQFQTMLQQLVQGGIAAEVVAKAVVHAIRERKFYILTHPEMKPAIEHRMRQILDEQQPGIDPLFRSVFG